MRDQSKAILDLRKEWKEVYLWDDKPNEFYQKHKHPYDTLIIIVDGELSLEIKGKNIKLYKGDKIIIKKDQEHEARAGKLGCSYIVAEGRKSSNNNP